MGKRWHTPTKQFLEPDHPLIQELDALQARWYEISNMIVNAGRGNPDPEIIRALYADLNKVQEALGKKPIIPANPAYR
jgi:hypothetical protein